MDKEYQEKIAAGLQAYEAKVEKALTKIPERKKFNVKRVYTPLDNEGLSYTEKLGFPGQYPFTRGVQPTMYRGRLWTMRAYAGFATAEETNARYKYLLNAGQTGLSVAMDLPTQSGLDSDAEVSQGEVGKVGVAIDSLADMEKLFEGIPLDAVSTSMTINGPAAVLLAMYVAVAEKQKALLDWARQTGAVFRSGRGIGYALLLESGLREGEIVLSGGAHAAAVGAAGAVGLSLPPAELAGALESGQISLSPAPPLRLAVTGPLSPYLSVRDLAWTLIRSGQCSGKAVVIRAPQLTAAQAMDLCGLLGAAGAVTALCVREDFPADETVDLTALQPMAAPPGDAARVVPAGETDGLRVNQVFIGGCGGGSLEALRETADLWRGRTVCPYVRVMVAPATSSVYVQALEEGLLDVFLDAGALVMNQGCSACWAQSQGRCDQAEVFVSTGSINCAGWAGRAHSGICLTTVRRAAQAALSGSLYGS